MCIVKKSWKIREASQWAKTAISAPFINLKNQLNSAKYPLVWLLFQSRIDWQKMLILSCFAYCAMMLSKQSGAGHPEISTFSISNAAAAAFLHAIHFLPSLLRLGKLEILCRDLGGSAATPFFLSHIVAALDLKKHIATAHNTRRKFSLTTTTVFYWCVMPADLVFEHHWTSRPSFTSSTWCLKRLSLWVKT